MREIPVAVGEIDRRVLATDVDAELGLIHNLCLESDRPDGQGVAHGFSLISFSGVGVVVGDEKIGEKGVNSGTPRSDMVADGLTSEKHTQDRSSTLSQCRCIG